MRATSPAATFGAASFQRHDELRAAGAGQQRRPRRERRLSLVALRLGFAAATGLLILAFASTVHRDGNSRSSALVTRLDAIADALDLGLDQVEVTGHRFTGDAEILDAVDLPNVQTFLTFDSAAVKARIERLPWVRNATVERVLPNRLMIKVDERAPFAVWRRGAQDILFDATGRQLAAMAPGAGKDLPIVSGEAAIEDAKRLLDLIAGYPEVSQRIVMAERIAGRRWRLVLDRGRRIELPAEADGAALAMLMEARPAGRLIDIDAAVIDLTVIRRVVIRGLANTGRG